MIDNYDSFTYNLVQYFGNLGCALEVYRNDALSTSAILKKNPRGIVISPGPGDPDEAGVSLELVKAAHDNDIPLLGVCLGHQCIGQALGGRIIRVNPMHGKTSTINVKDGVLFKGMAPSFKVARYHSLAIDPSTLPPDLDITAQTDDGVIMAVEHKSKPVYGVQFHPESIATENGLIILKNFLTRL